MLKQKFIQFARQHLTRFYIAQSVIRHFISFPFSYLHTTGWLESLRQNRPCDQNGEPLPWMNYPAIDLLRQHLTNDLALFEYGSGYSTLFFAGRVGSVISVEGDKAWIEKLQPELPANAIVRYCPEDSNGDYCRSILVDKQLFDVIIIDGRDRVNCLKQSITKLSKRGILLLDDAQRSEYKSGIDWVVNQGFKHLSLEGLQPNGFEAGRVSLFYREGNCFGL